MVLETFHLLKTEGRIIFSLCFVCLLCSSRYVSANYDNLKLTGNLYWHLCPFLAGGITWFAST